MSSKIVSRMKCGKWLLNQTSSTSAKLSSRGIKDHAGRKVVVITGASRYSKLHVSLFITAVTINNQGYWLCGHQEDGRDPVSSYNLLHHKKQC